MTSLPNSRRASPPMSADTQRAPRSRDEVLRAAAHSQMHIEAAEAAEVVRRQLAANDSRARALGKALRHKPPRLVVTCARGSSDHAATYAKYLIETRLGVTTTSAAPSLSSIYAESNGAPDVLFLAISQSGRSPDLLNAAERARRAGSTVLALVNDEASPLVDLADVVLPLKAGPERSVAATKSYIAALSAVHQLTAHWSQRPDMIDSLATVPDVLDAAWDCDWSGGLDGFTDARNLFVLGRGIGLGIAQEMALKFKETCGIHAEAFSTAEVRHGPMTIIGDGFPVLIIGQPDETLDGVVQTARELVARKARVFCAGFDLPGAVTLPTVRTTAALQPLAAVQSFYRMTNAVAFARGLDPDRPPHLAKVTETL